MTDEQRDMIRKVADSLRASATPGNNVPGNIPSVSEFVMIGDVCEQDNS